MVPPRTRRPASRSPRGRAADDQVARQGSAPATAVDGGFSRSCSGATARSATADRWTCVGGGAPIPLQRVKRPGSGPFSETNRARDAARVPHRQHRPGQRPNLLTRRKERRKTLPMELGPAKRSAAARAREAGAVLVTAARGRLGRHGRRRAETARGRVEPCESRHLPRAASAGRTACRGSRRGARGPRGTAPPRAVGIGLAGDRRRHPSAGDHDGARPTRPRRSPR